MASRIRGCSVVVLFAVAHVALVACDTTEDQRTRYAQATLLEACHAYAGALEVLAGQKQVGALSPEEKVQIDALNTVVDPICTNPTPPADPLEALNRVTTSITQALLVANQHKVDVE